MLEVVMAMGVMTVGAMGLLALQTTTAAGNIEAREMATAGTVTRLWIERLRRDALQWTPNDSNALNADISRTSYLKLVPAAGTVSQWFTPIPAAGNEESYAFDYLGADTKSSTSNTRPINFCVQTRLQWLFPGQAIRADVRVWWHRYSRTQNATASDRRLYPNCGIGTEGAIAQDVRVRFITTSTVLRPTPL